MVCLPLQPVEQAKQEWYIRAVNDLRPDLIALTGDFIASSVHFIPACATALEKPQVREDVFACLGRR